MNASDTRNKSAVEEELKDVTSGNWYKNIYIISVFSFTVKNNGHRLVIMDEVDGMSSGDRGGMSELIKIIDKTKCPIICICNDRQNNNVRTLASHCKDLQFSKPPLVTIRSRMQKMAEKEGLKIDDKSIDTIIESSNYDIRQILNNLQMLNKIDTKVDKDYINKNITSISKDKILAENAFESCKLILFTDETVNKVPPFSDRLSAFFVDYDLVPLLIHV